jgi:hypothetical protein
MRRDHDANSEMATQGGKERNASALRGGEIKKKLRKYAKFLNASESYVVAEALKLLFRKDNEFRNWLDRQTPGSEPETVQPRAVAKSA